jgi:hypothetical protein
MRRIAGAAAIVAGVALAAVAVVVLNLNRIVEANRERIVAGVATGFARPVEIERITTGFHGGIALALEGLRVADDPAFSKDDFLTAARTYAVVRPWPLLRGQVEVRRIVVTAPHVTIIRTAHGMNVDSLGRRSAPAGPPSAPSGPGEPAPIPAVAVAFLNVEDGVVRWIDRTGPKAVETTIEPLNVHLSDLSLTSAMHVEIDATTSGAAPTTVRVHGPVGPVGDPPFAADVPIEQHVMVRGGTFEVADLVITGRVRRAESGAPMGSVTLSAARLEAPGVAFGDFEASATEDGGVATLTRLAFKVFGGTVEGKGRIDHTGPVPTCAFDTTVRGLDVSQALAARAPDTAKRFDGRLDADWSLAASAGDEALVRRTLAGKGHAVIRDGRLRGVNIVDGVLSGVTGGAGLVNLVPHGVRDRYPEIFATDDTRFDELSSDVRIKDERILVDSFDVVARDYVVRGKGVVTFAQQVDLTATLAASQRLTGDIVGAMKQALYLTDDGGRLAIPFRLTGVLPNVRPKPDLDFVTRVLRKALVGEGLDKLLGGNKQADPPSGKSHPDSDKDIIKKGLDKLFGR